MTQRNVNLPDEQNRFITEKVASGQYNNASEVVREALRQMQERDRERAVWFEHLRAVAAERFAAFDRGEGVETTVDELVADLNREFEGATP
jgi:antitoxin ParD1/3/4